MPGRRRLAGRRAGARAWRWPPPGRWPRARWCGRGERAGGRAWATRRRWSRGRVADALAGGHSIRGALGEAARGGGIPAPAGRELAALAHALDLGEALDIALERLRDRARTPAYDLLVAAILLQREAGGDLAGLLRELAGALEDAARAARDARTATAQARFTGLLVAGLPLGALALGEVADPAIAAGAAALTDHRGDGGWRRSRCRRAGC